MSKYKTLIITTIYLFVIEIVFNILLYKHLTIDNIVFYLLQSITISSIINIISEFFEKTTRKIVLIGLSFLIPIFYISQFVHYSLFECFYSIYSFIHGAQIFGFISAIISTIKSNIIGTSLLTIILISIVVTIIKTKEQKQKKSILLLVLVISITTSIVLSFIPTNNIYSRKNLLTKANVETKNAQSFGLLNAMIIDTYRFISHPKYDLFIEKNSDNYTKDKYNITNLNIKKTNDKEIKKLHQYLKNSEPTNKNEYTGIFKDKNLIFITAESFSFSLINKETTPTLYKLANEGLNFTNFYTPLYYVSTADGEYTNLTGLLPKEGTWSYIATQNNQFPYTYSSIFKEKNYTINGYHNGTHTFYNRNKIMTKLDYNFKACGNGLEKQINCKLWPQSDDEMITKTYNDYKDSKKFYTYYMTISGHLHYNFTNNDIAKKHQDKVKELDYQEHTKAYISANIDLDKALEHLLKNLEKDKKLEDTVIVLVPDHFPYGLTKQEYRELTKLDTKYAKHKSGLIIYNPELKKKTIDKYASNIDILPTLLNMFEIDYDSRLLIGKDIMSNSEGIVIFNNHSFLTEKGYYDERINRKPKNKYFKNKQKEVFNKINASSIILEKNYYKYLK